MTQAASAPTRRMSAALPSWAAKLCCVVAALIWGSSFFVLKDTLDVVPPNLILAIRFAFAALILGAVFARRLTANFVRGTVLRGLALGVLLFGAYCLQTIGLMHTTPGKNAFLTGVYCVLVPFLFWAFDKTRPTRFNVVAAVLCVAGIGFVSLSGGEFSLNAGDALTLAASILYALHIVATAKFSGTRDVFVLTVWQFVAAGACAWVASLLFEPSAASVAWTGEVIGVLAYLTLACTLVALLFQNIGTKYNTSPSSTSLLLSLESPSGVAFSVAFAGEVLTAQLVAGFALIFLAIVTSETQWSFLRRRP